MDWYMHDLPEIILNTVKQHLNCEDIAMSFLISSMTNGQPSLLADYWSIKSMIKLYVEKKISGNNDHKKLRDQCVDSFARMLGLKEGPSRLQMANYVHKKNGFFDCGAETEPNDTIKLESASARAIEHANKVKVWQSMKSKEFQTELRSLMARAGFEAYRSGLVEKSERWKQRFGKTASTAK